MLEAYLECLRFPARNLRGRANLLRRLMWLNGVTVAFWALLDPFLQKRVIDNLEAVNLRGFFGFLGLMLGGYILSHWVDWINATGMARLRNLLGKILIDRSLAALYAERITRNKRAGAKLINRVHGESSQLAELVMFNKAMSSSIISGILSLVFCAWLSPISLIPVVVLAGAVVAITSSVFRSSQTDARLQERLRSSAMSNLSINLDAIPLFSIYRILGKVRRSVQRGFAPYFKVNLRWEFGKSRVARNVRIMMSVMSIFILMAAALVVVYQHLSLGSFFALTASYWRVMSALREISDQLPNLASNYGRIRRFDSFCRRSPDQRRLVDKKVGVLQLDDFQLMLGGGRHVGPFHLNLRPGARLGVIGSNGSGKTSLLAALAGEQADYTGRIDCPRPVSIALSPPSFPNMSVLDLLKMDARTLLDTERIQQLALQLGLRKSLEENPSPWSDGEKRRLGILLALSKPARLYVFDEPLSGVDQESKSQLLKVILDETRNAVCVVAMHEQEFTSCFSQVIDMCQPHLVQLSVLASLRIK